MDVHWAAGGGAIATALTGAAIVWQAVLTRQSVKIAERIAVETVRGQLAEKAPLLLFALSRPEWPPRRRSQLLGGMGPTVSRDDPLRLPRDNAVLVEAAVAASVRNASNRPVRLRLHPPLALAQAESLKQAVELGAADEEYQRIAAQAPLELTLAADSEVIVLLRDALPVSRWLGSDHMTTAKRTRQPRRVLRAALRGVQIGVRIGASGIIVTPPVIAETAPRPDEPVTQPRVSGVLEVVSFEDAAAVDRYTISVSGAPFERIPDDDGGIRLRGTPMYSWGGPADPLRGEVTQERAYWLSRQRNEQLPDPNY